MKVIQINTTCGSGSTGRIAVSIAECAKESGIDNKIVYGYGSTDYTNAYKVQTNNGYLLNNIFSRLFSCEGATNYYSTRKLISFLEVEKPDIIHLHNIHGHYIHCGELFKYIKKKNIKIIWTLHDCWSFTGQCPYFTLAKCDKWKNGCYKCEQYRNYPQYLWDNTRRMWMNKHKWFTGVENLTIVTPSRWLANEVRQSFLGGYPVRVINNGINLNVFKPTDSNFRFDHHIKQYMILGVSFEWGIRKGLDIFIKLSELLPENYTIVLVGTSEEIDKKLPKSIVSIHKTQDQTELAAIYSAADVFLMPTREDNFPTVNMESIACGTPVITFDTGGSPEMLDEKTGVVLSKEDVEQILVVIKDTCENNRLKTSDCLSKAKDFDQRERFREYIGLYKEVEE